MAGIGGVGMSALAEALLDQGCAVTGSDRAFDQGQQLDSLDVLQRAGVRLVPQDGSGITAETRALAVSTAIEQDNPELAAAGRHGVEVIHRAAMLARLAVGRRLIAVTGTAGKTSVTGMVGHLLERAGWDPTVVNGGIVLNWAGPARLGNVRKGGGEWWVIEADESDRSLLQFRPDVAIITNVSKDHFELSEVVQLFGRFAAQVREPIVAGRGVGAQLGLSVCEPPAGVSRIGDRWTFTLDDVEFRVPMPGRHNAENALLAVYLCRRMGIPAGVLGAALEAFRGIHRRLEVVGERNGIRVVDDYAHNPAKLAASWRAVAETAARVHGYWRPHGFGPLALMKDELVDSFAGVVRPDDRLYVLPVFYAGGTAQRTVTSEDLVLALRSRGVPVSLVADYGELERAVRPTAKAGDTILGMGARDPELPRFARRLADLLAS